MYIFGYKTTVFIQNLYISVKLFYKKVIFSVKSTIFFIFQDQMYIFGYKTTLFIQNLYILVKYFSIFRNQMYIFGYKTKVSIENLYILVKFFGKNFIFKSKKYKFFGFSEPNVHFCAQNYSFYPKFVHFSEIFLAKTLFLE